MTSYIFNGARAIISTNTTITVASSGGDYTSLGDALDSLAEYAIASDVYVTISLAGEVFTVTPYVYQHKYGERIKVQGETPLTPTISSVQSSSGGAGAWSIVLNLDSVAGITTDMICNIPYKNNANATNLSGGSNTNNLCGSWAITDVDSGNNRITITSTHKGASAPSGAVTGTAYILSTVLTWALTGTETMFIADSSIADFDNVAFLGAGSGTCVGILARGVNTNFIMGKNISYLGQLWGGAYAQANSYLQCYNQCASDVDNGFVAYLEGNINASYCTATGCGNGMIIGQDSQSRCNSGLLAGNTYGLTVSLRSYVLSSSAVYGDNATNDIKAASYSYVYAASATASSLSPAANTQGNEYGYIDT